MKRILAVLFLIFLLISCGSDGIFDCDCDNEMDDIRGKYGPPEELNSYVSGDYHSVDWWYWSKGIEYTFTWGGAAGCCEESLYEFTPITAYSEYAKETVRASQSGRIIYVEEPKDLR